MWCRPSAADEVREGIRPLREVPVLYRDYLSCDSYIDTGLFCSLPW